MKDYEVLQFNQYPEYGFWIFFSIIILFFLFLFFSLMIRTKKTTTGISEYELEKKYQSDFKNAKDRINGCRKQWQLDKAIYSISRFQKTYSKVKNKLLLEQDVNKLVKEWEKKKESIELTPSLLEVRFS